jgi:hypothetical protein
MALINGITLFQTLLVRTKRVALEDEYNLLPSLGKHIMKCNFKCKVMYREFEIMCIV